MNPLRPRADRRWREHLVPGGGRRFWATVVRARWPGAPNTPPRPTLCFDSDLFDTAEEAEAEALRFAEWKGLFIVATGGEPHAA